MKISYKYPALFIGIMACCLFTANGQDGVTLFKKNCAACHKLGSRLVGPDLIGIDQKRSEEWLLSFIRSSNAMIEAGDPDAVAIYKEYNETIMTDMLHLSDDDIRSILAYIKEKSPAPGVASQEKKEPVEVKPIEYSAEDIQQGLRLFSGQAGFVKGGPSCISCHHVNNKDLLSGGLIAKDLTNVYGRMADAGLAGILGAPPFPAMATAYNNHELDSTEIAQVTAFLKHADNVSHTQPVKTGTHIFLLGGGGGLFLLFLVIAIHWNSRLKASTKHDIYKRQLKSI